MFNGPAGAGIGHICVKDGADGVDPGGSLKRQLDPLGEGLGWVGHPLVNELGKMFGYNPKYGAPRPAIRSITYKPQRFDPVKPLYEE